MNYSVRFKIVHEWTVCVYPWTNILNLKVKIIMIKFVILTLSVLYNWWYDGWINTNRIN